MSKDRARTRFACEIARVHPGRFNELVAAGGYRCAPKTIAGSARVFGVNDIIGLIVYRHLADEGMSSSESGHMACGLVDLLAQHPEADRVLHIKNGLGSFDWALPGEVKPDADIISGSDIVSIREWRLTRMRSRIMHTLNEEDRIAGAE